MLKREIIHLTVCKPTEVNSYEYLMEDIYNCNPLVNSPESKLADFCKLKTEVLTEQIKLFP